MEPTKEKITKRLIMIQIITIVIIKIKFMLAIPAQ